MKILIVRTYASEVNCHNTTYNSQEIGLATELTRKGHECGIVYYAKKGHGFTETIQVDNLKVKIYHIEGKNILKDSIFNDKLYEICDQYDIIQTSESDQITSWLLYKRYPNKTIIYHGPYISEFSKKYNIRCKIFDILFSNRANYKYAPIIAKSSLAEQSLKKRGFKNVTTIGVGLNPYNFEMETDNIPIKIKTLINNKDDNKYLLYIGVITNRKNLKFVLMLLDKLVNEKGYKNYKLIIIGKKVKNERKYYEECWRYINKNGLNENIIYFERIEQKYLKFIYECSNIFILPTQYDIFGMVYLEAMYFGVPIVTTFCGGSSLLIEEEKTGFIKDITKPNEWIKKIIDILENESLRQKISNESERKIKNNYLWSNIVVEFEKIYKNIKR